ncbi:MAG: DDE-type integrase/transposase/recombinase [Xanthomonadales bacterium]|nr:DDE-type integrase/transposase/recombinase [Xanthomonadales bacterium]
MDYLRSVASRLHAAGHGQRGPLIDEAARWLGVSKPTLYDRLRAVGWSSGRKLRTDKGDSRVTEAEVMAVAGILRASQRQTGKELLPVGDAIDMALANGLLAERVSSETMLRLMRRHDCHPRQLARPSPHVNMRSNHPNHVWELDASVCVLYYLRNGRVGVMDERKFNVRKPVDLAKVSNQRVMRYACTDHYTGNVLSRYYNVAGEDQATLFEFMMWAMSADNGHVMHGVPWMLVWDAGSANMSHAIGALLTALMIRHWTHVPGNPRAKGQVEGVHNIIERKFEGVLTFARINSVEQLNAEMDQWLRAFNGTAIHSRHKHTRDGLWQTIRQEQLRLCPPVELCQVLMHSKPVSRVVKGNLTVQFTPKGYQPAVYSVEAVPNVRVGESVTVAVNPYRAPSIFIIGEAEDGSTRYVECEPIATDNAGFFVNAPAFGESYASKPDTDVDTARKDLNEATYGERDTLDAIAARNKGRLAFDGKIDPFKHIHEKAAAAPSHILRRGTDMDVPDPVHVDLKPLTHVQALFELRARLGRAVDPAEAALVREWYPDGIAESDIDALALRITDPAPTTRPRLSVVS